jgi:hypothetical protein|nr:MAG TPA: 10 kDa chaperonin [Caudoviricetes sp.]
MENDVLKLQETVIDAAADAFKDDIESVVGKVIENAQDLQIMPINAYVLVKPYEVNPYDKIEVSEGGLAMNTKEHKIFNQDKGEEEKAEMWERVGTVIEVSPLCKFLQEGDDIFYRKGQAIPISFLKLGLEVVAENQVLVVINTGVKERFNGRGFNH